MRKLDYACGRSTSFATKNYARCSCVVQNSGARSDNSWKRADFSRSRHPRSNSRPAAPTREHLQDYTQLETYEAYSDLKKGGDFAKDLYRHIAKEVYGKYTFEIGEHTVDLAEDWEVIDFCVAIKKEFGIDPILCNEEEAIAAAKEAGVVFGDAPNKTRAIDGLWKHLRKTITGPAFLVGVPVYLEPLAKRYDKNPETVERLQVIIAGSEIGKGYSELNDPQDQRARFEQQQKLREAGDEE